MLSSPCVLRMTSYRRMPISIVVRFAFAVSSYIMFFSMCHGNLLVYYVQVVCWQRATHGYSSRSKLAGKELD
jgi:hypothetical protein